MKTLLRELAEGFWAYLRAACGGLILAWLAGAAASGQSPPRSYPYSPVVLLFTDPLHCPPCRALECSWREAKPVTRRIAIDVRTAQPSDLAAWKVTAWPTMVLVEMHRGKVTHVYRRHVGAMSPRELLAFLDITAELNRRLAP